MLRPDGALLGFFGTGAAERAPLHEVRSSSTRQTLRHRPYPAARGAQAVLLNRDIIRLFDGLRVSDSFLLQNNLREKSCFSGSRLQP